MTLTLAANYLDVNRTIVIYSGFAVMIYDISSRNLVTLHLTDVKSSGAYFNLGSIRDQWVIGSHEAMYGSALANLGHTHNSQLLFPGW